MITGRGSVLSRARACLPCCSRSRHHPEACLAVRRMVCGRIESIEIAITMSNPPCTRATLNTRADAWKGKHTGQQCICRGPQWSDASVPVWARANAHACTDKRCDRRAQRGGPQACIARARARAWKDVDCVLRVRLAVVGRACCHTQAAPTHGSTSMACQTARCAMWRR